MDWLRRIMVSWLTNSAKKRREDEAYLNPIVAREQAVDLQRATTITLANAMNGYVVQLQTWKPSKSPMQDDQRVVTTYVLKNDEQIVEAVAALLMNHKLENK